MDQIKVCRSANIDSIASVDFESPLDMESESPESSSIHFGRAAHFNRSLRENKTTDEDETRHRRTWSGGLNIIEKFLGQFSASKQPKSLADELREYHDKNQNFLRETAAERAHFQTKGPLSTPFSKRFQKISNSTTYNPPATIVRIRSRMLESIGGDDWEEGNTSPEEAVNKKPVEILHASPAKASEELALAVEAHYRDNMSPPSSPNEDYEFRSFGLEPNFVDGLKQNDTEAAYLARNVRKERRQRRKKKSRNAAVVKSMKKDEKNTSNDSADQKTKGGSNKCEDEWLEDYVEELENEREILIAQWKAEFESESNEHPDSRQNQLAYSTNAFVRSYITPYWDSIIALLSYLEVFISNMPMTIGAVGLSWVTMGVVWFKFTEEMLPGCTATHYNNPQCGFLEFPGCFSGEGCHDNPIYQSALVFHYFCHFVAGTCCLVFLLKTVVAWRVVVDELSDPTKSTPMGVVCITMVCVFSGRGAIGEAIVLVTSAFHFCLAIWFFYMAHKFHMLPDPSWFPNTVGLAYASIKTWLYFPLPGKIMMTLTIIYFFSTFFISLIRVALNKKIAAPVCWIQLSAPSITLYAMTLMQQPSSHREKMLEESPALDDHFMQIHERLYMPAMHFMMILSLVGMVSALHSLWCRWDTFKLKSFSPAHAAFCFPTLSHSNAVQVYRGAVDTFSTIPPGSTFKQVLWTYWVTCLVIGTTVNLIFTYKFMVRLPEWTKVNITGEDEPPAPEETLMHEMLDETGTCDRFNQPFVSPAVLQANEAGALVRVRRGTADYRLHGAYVRSRHVASVGFDFPLDDAEFREERARLLDWVARNAPRTRNRTNSVPLVSSMTSSSGRGIYGSIPDNNNSHRRSNTLDPEGRSWV